MSGECPARYKMMGGMEEMMKETERGRGEGMGGEHPVLNVGWSGGEGGRGTGRAEGGGEWEVSYQQCAMCHPIEREKRGAAALG